MPRRRHTADDELVLLRRTPFFFFVLTGWALLFPIGAPSGNPCWASPGNNPLGRSRLREIRQGRWIHRASDLPIALDVWGQNAPIGPGPVSMSRGDVQVASVRDVIGVAALCLSGVHGSS